MDYEFNILNRKILKSKTNVGDLCKQYVYLTKDADGYSIMIHKYILCGLSTFKYFIDLKPLKEYKYKRLYFEHFGIKLSTMINILDFVNNYIKQE